MFLTLMVMTFKIQPVYVKLYINHALDSSQLELGRTISSD